MVFEPATSWPWRVRTALYQLSYGALMVPLQYYMYISVQNTTEQNSAFSYIMLYLNKKFDFNKFQMCFSCFTYEMTVVILDFGLQFKVKTPLRSSRGVVDKRYAL